MPSARQHGLASCGLCHLVVRMPRQTTGVQRCPRCRARLHFRRPQSQQISWALLLTAMMLYVPANTLPVMKDTYLGEASSHTILSGVILFAKEGDWFLAVVIFTASVLVPLLKMFSLFYLLISLRRPRALAKPQRALLYRITELVGRWSMVDVFVIGILTALVQMGAVSTVQPGPGALAFAGVVVVSMLAAISFDPRLIWDQLDHE